MRLGLAALLLASAIPGAASALEITASLDRQTARVGDEVILTVVVEGGLRSLPEPGLPEFGDEFEVYSGRHTSRNVSFVNGKLSSSLSVAYVLVPQEVGTFTIGSIEVESKGEVVRTEPLTLTVTAGTAPPTPAPRTQTETGTTSGNEDLFVRATVDKTSPSLYEQVTYRVRLYMRATLLENPGFTPPPTHGFWREELPSRQPFMEVVEGKRYHVLEVAIAVFPTAPGPLTIGESVLECRVPTERRGRDPFSFFGGSIFDGRRVVLRTDPISLDVMPLPPGAPPGFQGAVGEYELDVSVDRAEVPQNEPITLTARVTGRGNLRTLGEIELTDLPEFRSYPSESSQETTRDGDTIGGTLSQQFVLVPMSAGEKTLPAVELVVFSPQAGTYKTLVSEPIPVRVTPAAGLSGAQGPRGDIEVLGRDIRFIETELPQFLSTESAWHGARSWFVLLPFPAFLYGGVWLWERRRRRLGSDEALRRRLGAARGARRILRGAQGGTPAERAAKAGEAVRMYLADRYNLPRAGLTPERVATVLRTDDLDPGPVMEFLERTDATRYAPGEDTQDETEWLVEAAQWIDGLEKRR